MFNSSNIIDLPEKTEKTMNSNNNKKNGFAGIIICVIAIIALKAAGKIIGKLLSVILTIAVIGVLIFCGIVVFTALKDTGKDSPGASKAKTPSQDEAKLLSQGRTALAKLRTSNLKIRDLVIKEKSTAICDLADKILAALKKDPEKTGSCVELLRYYLPELADIISRYTAVQDQPGAPEITAKLSARLDSVNETMTKTLSAAASGQQLDISSDLEALRIALSLGDEALPKDEAEELAEKYDQNNE